MDFLVTLFFVSNRIIYSEQFRGPTLSLHIEEVKPSEQLTDLELAYVGSNEVKSVIDGKTFPEEGEIGLFLFKDELAVTPYGESGYTNVKYAYNSSKSRWTASPSIKVGSTPGYLFGYYPYSSTATDIKAIPVASSLNGDDVMYAEKVSNVTDATASQTAITMNHALARVSITVKNNGYTGAAMLSKIKFSGAKIAQEGTLNALNGSITATRTDDVTLNVTGDAQTITTAGTTYECLLVPSGEDGNKQTVTLTLTIDGIDKEATLSGDNGVIIAQNTKSNITINLSNSGISVQTVSVEDWNVVEVGGHKVTVKVDETDAVSNDILFWTYADGNTAKIEAFSKSGITLGCIIAGDAQCQKTTSDNIYTFTISDITSDITATIGYPHVSGVTLDRTSVNPAKGWIVNLKATIIAPEDATNKNVSWSSDNTSVAEVDENGNVTAIAEGEANITVTTQDGGKTAQCVVTVGEAIKGSLPYEFSVSDTKKVHFSKGNLWYGKVGDASEATFNFESSQYDTTPSSNGERDENHISHFTWCNTAEKGMALAYDYKWDSDSPFFAAKDFTVNGFSVWRALTGNDNGEWEYLLDKRKTTYGENRRYAAVKVNGMAGVLIFPDNFSWPDEEISEPTTFNANESNWNNLAYSVDEFNVLQKNGCVFLPAAGKRLGFDGEIVQNVGSQAYYWSALGILGEAYCLYFTNMLVYPSFPGSRSQACSLRLVTEVN